MQIKLIFTTKVSHLASFWKWDFLELGNGLLFPHEALIVPSTTNSMPARVYHMNIDQSHPESRALANILAEKELSNIHKGVVCFHRQLMRL